MQRHVMIVSLASVFGISLPALSQAQDWSISEVFTNSDGDVQYVELSSDSSDQGALSGLTMVSMNDNDTHEFVLDSDLAGETAGASLLLATSGFVSLTGLTPDYTLPDGFVPLPGGSLNFAQETDTLEYVAGQMPLNGVQALSGDLLPVIPGPTNFAGLSASVSVDPVTTFDASDNSINVPVLEAPGVGVGNVNFSVNLESLEFTLRDDFFLYGSGITAGNAGAEFQNGAVLHIPALRFGNELFEASLTILGDDPITFGNPEVLSVVPVPEPEPDSDTDEQSITRGMNIFNAQCQQCHGSSGQGGIGPNLINSSFNTFVALQNKIDTAMPRNNPSACTDSDGSTCATDAANYILNVFQQNGN
ncbi:MAG: hypothetical protein PsegKO_19150 [Pseudohongiellaceae bacterium]